MGEQVGAGFIKWGCSSVGRAPALQAGGQEFESLHLHLIIQRVAERKKRCFLSAQRQGKKEYPADSFSGLSPCTLKTTYRKQIFYLIKISEKTSEVVIIERSIW